MQCNLLYRPVSTLAQIHLDRGEQLLVEPGAMVGMSPNVAITTGLPGGSASGGGLFNKLAGAASRLLTGESFFQNTYTAEQGPGELLLTHRLPGDMVWLDVPTPGLKLQSTAYIACTSNVRMNAELGGYRTFFAGEGLFVINTQALQAGERVLVGAFGGIQELTVSGSLKIDNGHLVAWDGQLTFNLSRAGGGWVSSFLSGEGMVCEFQGSGRVWIQTRNPNDYGVRVGPLLPTRSN